MGPLGWQETIMIFVVALLIFGPKKLPELGRNVAKAIAEFRRASSDLKAQFDREMHSIERETESLKEVTREYANDVQSSYDSSYYDYGYDSGTTDTPADNTSLVGASEPSGAEQTAAAGTETSTAPEGTVAQQAVPDQPVNGVKAAESSPLAT